VPTSTPLADVVVAGPAGAGKVWFVVPEPKAAGALLAGAATVGSSGGKVWVVVVVVCAAACPLVTTTAAQPASNSRTSALLVRQLLIGDRDLHPLGRRRDGIE
jgi:hypothetical protein